MSTRYDQLKDHFNKAGQGHCLRFAEGLDATERTRLVSDLEGVDLQRMTRMAREAQQPPARRNPQELKPHPYTVQRDADHFTKWEARGLEEIAAGHVAVLLLAGGQGTRLGVSAPKGMYDIGLPSHKSLFVLEAERLLRVQTLAARHTNKESVCVPWYIMTSDATADPTREFFKEHQYFGLQPTQVAFFSQGQLPCLTLDGYIMMETKSKVSRAPDGNGGVYEALNKSGALDEMERRNIKYVHVFGVDNALVKVADPVFIGFCVEQGKECGAKVVSKGYPEEAIGLFCLRNGVPEIVEYSELDKTMAEERNEKGDLIFNAGNIANHFFTVEFLRRIAITDFDKLPYHVAKKRIPCVGDDGVTRTPTEVNGSKLELFIFDAFSLCDGLSLLMIDREEEFAPVKNKPGSPIDSPDTARALVSAFARRCICAAGGVVEGDGLCEISPLISLVGEDLQSIVHGIHFLLPIMALHFGRIGFIVPAQTLFLCCDIQERFRSLIPGMSADAGHRSVIRVGQTMLHAARIFDIPTVVTEQYPKALGKTVPELDTTGTQVFEKTLFSMITPEVEANVLNQIQPKSAVLFGIEAHVCVLQTALDLLSRDIEVHIVSDGVDSQKPLDRDTGLLRAQQAGAFITTCESLLFQLMRTKDHPKFKQISALAKERNDQILKASTK